MIHENQDYKYHTNNVMGVLIGTLVGGLAGALTMLLLAPQSGKDTRMQIKEKSRKHDRRLAGGSLQLRQEAKRDQQHNDNRQHVRETACARDAWDE